MISGEVWAGSQIRSRVITMWARHRHKESGSRDNNPGEQSVGIWEACHKGKVLSLSWAQIPVRVIAPDARVLEIEVVWWGMGRETCYWSSPGYGFLVTSKDT